MSYKICPKCGKQLSSDAVLCIGCGTILSDINKRSDIFTQKEQSTDSPQSIKTENLTEPEVPGAEQCINCGKPLTGNGFFCKSCGAMQDGSNLNTNTKVSDKTKESQKKQKLKKQKTKKNTRSKKRKHKKAKKTKKAKWPIFLVLTFLLACFAAGLFLSDEDNRSWLMGLFTGENQSTVDLDELAQKQIDIYDLHGKKIDNVVNDIGLPLSTREKTDVNDKKYMVYDFGLFKAEANEENIIDFIYVDYTGIEDKSVILTYGISGASEKSQINTLLGEPDKVDESEQMVYYYPADTVAVKYTFDDQQIINASVYYDESVSSSSEESHQYDNVVETTEWLGRYIRAVESLLGDSRSLGSNSFGGHTYIFDGVTLDTNELDVICKVEINYDEVTSNNKLLASTLFYGDDKETMLYVIGGEPEQSGSSYTFTKSGIKLTFLLDSSDKIKSAMIES